MDIGRHERGDALNGRQVFIAKGDERQTQILHGNRYQRIVIEKPALVTDGLRSLYDSLAEGEKK